jgi:RNA polymerase-binding transcription factor
MARSTRNLIAGTAAAAARRVLPRRAAQTSPGSSAPTTEAVATKAAPAARSTTAASKSTAKKTAAKKTAAKKAPAKKAPAKPAKKAPAKPAAKTTAAKKTAKKAVPAKTAKAASNATSTRTAATRTAKKAAPKTGVKKVTTKRTAPKKVPAKKVASLESLAVKEGEDAWTKAELNEVLEELHEHADRLRTELHDQELELAGLMRDAGDGAGQDQADLGATSFERDHELTVVNNSREMLAQTERALARIADGSYGVCESCGNPIGKMRVMAFPRATLCLSCKQREERR